MKLGTLLLRDGIINLDQLEAALRAQVLFGGRLGTNLVELGHLSLDQLTTYLARTLGLPEATQAKFEGAEPRAVERLGPKLAEKHGAFAFALEAGEPEKLHLTLLEPRDRAALIEIERELGVQVVLYAAPELRTLFYLERHYGLGRKVRFVRVAPPGGVQARGGGEERRRFLSADGSIPPQGAVSIQPRRNTNPGLIVAPAPVGGGGDRTAPYPATIVSPVGGTPGARPPAPTPAPAAPPAVEPAAPAAVEPAAESTLMATLERLDAAHARDAIADAVLGFARPRLGATVLFLLRDGVAIGWRGVVPGLAADALERMALPLGAPSCLASAYDTRMPWRGAPAAPLDTTLAEQLQLAAPPAEAITLPILIGSRVVNLIYAHADGGATLDDGVVDGLITVAEAAGDAYARIIKETKGK